MNKKAEGMAGIATVSFFVILFIGIFFVFMCVDFVPAGNIGVIDNLGTVSDTTWGPGVKWTGFFASTQKFSTRIQLAQYDASAASKDLQIVKTKVALNYKVNPLNVPELYKTIGHEYQDIIIAPIVQEGVKSSTAKYNAEELIQKRDNAKADITNYITDKLESKGLMVTEVAITDFDFSAEYNEAIEEKQVAAQDALTAENRYNEMVWTSKSMELQSQVIEIKKLDLQQQWIARWDGHLPYVMGGDSGNLLQMDLMQMGKINQSGVAR